MRSLLLSACAVCGIAIGYPAPADALTITAKDVARLNAITGMMAVCTAVFDETTPTEEEYLITTGQILRYTIIGLDGTEHPVDREEYRRFLVARCMVERMQEDKLFEPVEQTTT